MWDPKLIELEENIRGKLHDTGCSNDFLDMRLKAQSTKAKLDKWDYIQLKNFCSSNDIMLWNGRKYFQVIYLKKRLISRIYKDFLQLNYKKSVNQILKGAKDLDIFPRMIYIQMANRHRRSEIKN